MTAGYSGYTWPTSNAAGSSFERHRRKKGLIRPALQPLLARAVIAQSDDIRALDWYQLEVNPKPHRWSGPNPRPKILIPFTGGNARVSIEVVASRPGLRLDEVGLYVEGRRVICTCDDFAGLGATIRAEISLSQTDCTILTLETPMFFPRDYSETTDLRSLGVAVGDIILEPIPARTTAGLSTSACVANPLHP